MKKLLLLLAVLLIAGSTNAALVLHYDMDSADDFTVGDGTNGSAVGRLYVDNEVTGTTFAAMTATGGIQYDAAEGAIYMDGVHPCRIYGQEDPSTFFTNNTQYSFSLWEKGSLSATSGNGYAFYVKLSDGTRFKFDLSLKPANSFVFSAPGAGWQSNSYHIWDPDPAYADRYVDPETWNMYSATWNADTGDVATYVNGVKTASYTYSLAAIPAGTTVTEYGFGDGYGWSGPGGWFKDFMIFDTALTDAEVAALVPEPATIALLGLGGLALIRKRK
jgi:hypothetical protein